MITKYNQKRLRLRRKLQCSEGLRQGVAEMTKNVCIREENLQINEGLE